MEAATARIASLDLSKLPPEIATRIAGTTDGVMSVFGRVEAIRAAEAAVDEASVGYRPIHSEVRTIERDIRRLERERLQIERDIRGVDDASKRASMMADIEEIKAEIRSLENEIPANWKSVNKDYKKITLALKKERTGYRRAVDKAYGDLVDAIAMLESADALAGLRPMLSSLPDKIRMDRHDAEAEAALIEATAAVAEIAGGEAIAAELDKAAKGFSSRRFKPEDGKAALENALTMFETEVAGRAAGAVYLAQLQTYEAEIRDTIGLRQQDRLSTEQATSISGCLARHRDISLSF